MMYLLKHKSLAVIVGGLLVFSACKKDSDSNSGPAPVTEPLTVAAAKPADTLSIKGQNFSTTASGNTVKVGDVEATVISATATEVKIVIPAISTPGTYTVKVTVNGKTTEVGSIVIAPLTFYGIKGNFENGTEYQVITVSPYDGKESLVASIGKDRINSVIYFPATNEIMGVNDTGNVLVRVNVTTKQVTTKRLPSSADIGTSQLVVDNNNTLYGIKYDWSGQMQTQTLVKIDPATGATTGIKKFTEDDDWYEPVYVPATNEIVGIMNDGKRLFRLNLTTKDTIGVSLPGSTEAPYQELIVDNKSNLYAYKAKFPGNGSDVAKLVKVNAVTGQETLIKSLPVDGKYHDKIIYVPKQAAFNDMFIGTWNQQGVLGVDAVTLNYLPLVLTTSYSKTYNYLTTN
jgi:hypothetical protein